MTQATITNPRETAVAPEAKAVGGRPWLAVHTLVWRELTRFFRQRGRIAGAIATPVLLWLAIGVGLDQAFVMPLPAVTDAGAPSLEGSGAGVGDQGPGYLTYFYPGMVLMMVLFTAIFSTISVIEDRKEGFLQAVLVSPAPRWAVVLGKVVGGASVAAVQGVVLVALWPVVGPWPGVAAILGAMAVVFVIALGMTALGLCFAWRMDSAGAYHGVMSVVLMPMWLLCGAVFPLASSGVMKYLMYANPLTYGYAMFSGLLHNDGGRSAGITLAVSTPITLGLTGLVLMAVTRIASASRADGK